MLAPQPPFAFAWSGVSPGAIAVNLSGTVAVAGPGGQVQDLQLRHGPQLSQTCQVSQLLGLAPSASGDFYALGVLLALFQLKMMVGSRPCPGVFLDRQRIGIRGSQGQLDRRLRRKRLAGSASSGETGPPLRPQCAILKQGLWPDKGRLRGLQRQPGGGPGGRALPAGGQHHHPGAYIALRHLLLHQQRAKRDPAAAVSYAWDVALPVHAGDGYGLVSVTWAGVPHVADRHGRRPRLGRGGAPLAVRAGRAVYGFSPSIRGTWRTS